MRVVPNCKSKLSYVSSIKKREKDTTSMSHLVTRIEKNIFKQNQIINAESCCEEVRSLKTKFWYVWA